MPDRLQQMMDNQVEMQDTAFGQKIDGMTSEQRIEYITWNVLALTDELHEALHEISWKPWASAQFINEDALQGELIDAWHFLMNLFAASGLSPETVYIRYMAKQKINKRRQEQGYTGVDGKCASCGRALDDPATHCTTEPAFCVDAGFLKIG